MRTSFPVHDPHCAYDHAHAREGGVVAGYRDFSRPVFASSPPTVTDWMQWLLGQDVLREAAPRPAISCSLCGGAVGTMYNGTPFARCPQCRNYGNEVTALIPITYSLDEGLESMLHRYKDFGVQWLEGPLRSLLWYFTTRHGDCVKKAYGPFDLALAVPSDNLERGFDHLERIAAPVGGGEPPFQWRFDIISRNRAVSRPKRGELKPDAYIVTSNSVQGKSVILLDDTWTSGASIASAAAALRHAGAQSVTALTLGRQLNSSWTFLNNQELVGEVRARGWGMNCVICSQRPT